MHNLATDSSGMTANDCTVKDLLCGLEACREDLAGGTRGSEDLDDVRYGADTVSTDVLKTAYIGSDVGCACVRSEHSLSRGKNCGNGNAVALVGKSLTGSETNGSSRNLNEGVLLVAEEGYDCLCLLDDLLVLGLGDLYVELLLLADDGTDVLKKLKNVAALLREDGGVGGYALDREVSIKILNILEVRGLKNNSNFVTS